MSQRGAIGRDVCKGVGCKRAETRLEKRGRDQEGTEGGPEEANRGIEVRVRLRTWASAGSKFGRLEEAGGQEFKKAVVVLGSHHSRKQDPRRNRTTGFGNRNGFGHEIDISV